MVGALGAGIGTFIQRRVSFGQAIIGFTWYFALAFTLYAVAGTPALLCGIVAFSLLFGPTYDIVQYTYRIAIIPDALQGRVNSVFRLISWGVRPLGFALIGVLLERAGGVTTVLIIAGWLAFVALLTTLNRHVRDAPSLATLPTQ